LYGQKAGLIGAFRARGKRRKLLPSKKQATVMKNAPRLYDALLYFVGQSAWSDPRHASVLVWMVIGVIHEGSVNLTRWLVHV